MSFAAASTNEHAQGPELSPADVGFAPDLTSELAVEQARRIRATLGADVSIHDGLPLPPLWHWGFFNQAVSTTELGPDGHPRLSSGSPTAGFPRRMWAGGRVETLEQLSIGAPARRTSQIRHVERKEGRSGHMVLV